MTKVVFFDLETQKLAAEVGGWANIEALGLAVACTHDDDMGYRDWLEAQAADLLEELHRASLIVGFGVNQFDYRVLSLYGDASGLEAKTFDILDEVFAQTGRRLALNVLAKRNLGEAKSLESGVGAIRLWRTGKLDELLAYCQRDVELTRRLYELWEARGLLWVSPTEYVVWPGVRTAEDVKELDEERRSGGAGEQGSRGV
jgi:DEAD/DEAH box helicase domain-containing protein